VTSAGNILAETVSGIAGAQRKARGEKRHYAYQETDFGAGDTLKECHLSLQDELRRC